MLTTRDVNEIADTEHDAVRVFDEKTKPKEPTKVEAADMQQPPRMSYASVGTDGKVEFRGGSSQTN